MMSRTLIVLVLAVLVVPTPAYAMASLVPEKAAAPAKTIIAARPTPVATVSAVFERGMDLEMQDPACLAHFRAGFDWRSSHTLQVPTQVEGQAVTVSRIVTVLEGQQSPAGPTCIIVTRDGCWAVLSCKAQPTEVHRGFAGTWSTDLDQTGGPYRVIVPAPLAYRATVVVELVAA